ncbi:MAG: methyltransferase [Clostridium sp.]|nr:methyltransferase [Clostridium sp.]
MKDASDNRRQTSFRFKRFAVADSRSAMKIGTDGVLLGAWATVEEGVEAWDVGAGSGVISLMLAQRGAATVTAVEIDPGAAADLRDNAAASPWPGRILSVEGDFRRLWHELPAPGLIVSNPPFFDEALRSPDPGRAAARHEGSLTFADIFRAAGQRLPEGGRLSLAAPFRRLDDLVFEAELSRLRPERIARVVTTEGKPARRVLIEFRKSAVAIAAAEETLTIRLADGSFSDRYHQLCNEFYLKL